MHALIMKQYHQEADTRTSLLAPPNKLANGNKILIPDNLLLNISMIKTYCIYGIEKELFIHSHLLYIIFGKIKDQLCASIEMIQAVCPPHQGIISVRFLVLQICYSRIRDNEGTRAEKGAKRRHACCCSGWPSGTKNDNNNVVFP